MRIRERPGARSNNLAGIFRPEQPTPNRRHAFTPLNATASRLHVGASANHHPTCDVTVALPVRPLAIEEGVVRCWLDIAFQVGSARSDPVLPGGQPPQVKRPE